jgi:hypothetical protein
MINFHLILGIIAGLLSMLAVVPYIKDIIHGTTRPNVVSWSLWVLLLVISIWAQISDGSSWSVIFLVGDLIGTSSIVVLCLMGYGYGKYGAVEWVCLALSVLAIILWQVTNEPLLAIICAVVADATAAVPTVVKTYRDPWSEVPTGWFMVALGGILAILSTIIWNSTNLLFPLYILLINGIIGLVALTGRRLKKLV